MLFRISLPIQQQRIHGPYKRLVIEKDHFVSVARHPGFPHPPAGERSRRALRVIRPRPRRGRPVSNPRQSVRSILIIPIILIVIIIIIEHFERCACKNFASLIWYLLIQVRIGLGTRWRRLSSTLYLVSGKCR